MIKIICTLMFLGSLLAHATQEEVLGPNQGQLKLVGNFYSEVISNKDGSFHVYLLDKETKKPTVRYSYVTGFVELPSQVKVEVLCVAQKTYFECYPRGVSLKKAKKLSLSLARENVNGGDVVYDLPIFNPNDLKTAKARIQALQVGKTQKFISFRNGKRAAADTTALEANESYCALENIKLQNLKIKTTKKANLKIEKIEFPNEQKVRYSVLQNKDYSIFCDFTADKDFKVTALITKINQHMAGFLRILN